MFVSDYYCSISVGRNDGLGSVYLRPRIRSTCWVRQMFAVHRSGVLHRGIAMRSMRLVELCIRRMVTCPVSNQARGSGAVRRDRHPCHDKIFSYLFFNSYQYVHSLHIYNNLIHNIRTIFHKLCLHNCIHECQFTPRHSHHNEILLNPSCVALIYVIKHGNDPIAFFLQMNKLRCYSKAKALANNTKSSRKRTHL